MKTLQMRTKIMAPRKRVEVSTATYTGRFAVRLRELREKAGLSVEELGEKSGIPFKTIYGWESASRSPSIEHLPALAQGLGVKIGKLLPEN